VKCAGWAWLALAACARERPPAPRAAAPPPPPYRTVEIAGAGRVDGVVSLAGGARMEEVIVWLDGIRAGKPLPLARRFEIDHESGELVPRAQAAIRGGMLNVRNADDTAHRARFTLVGAEPVTDSLLAVVEESGAGQVVPVPGPLARVGLVRVTCDLHPATRGWIRVFDQPYFTMPDSAGRFVFDSVPPGRWRLRAWSAVAGENGRDVIVDSAGAALIELRLPP
jgi:hypothetical protein